MGLTVSVLREAFRNIADLRALYENEGIDVIQTSDGQNSICLWDLEYLLTQLFRLPDRQRQAIQLCLIENRKEQDAALIMGVSITNPVAMYATSGLEKIIKWINAGELPRYTGDGSPSWHEEEVG